MFLDGIGILKEFFKKNTRKFSVEFPKTASLYLGFEKRVQNFFNWYFLHNNTTDNEMQYFYMSS